MLRTTGVLQKRLPSTSSVPYLRGSVPYLRGSVPYLRGPVSYLSCNYAQQKYGRFKATDNREKTEEFWFRDQAVYLSNTLELWELFDPNCNLYSIGYTTIF